MGLVLLSACGAASQLDDDDDDDDDDDGVAVEPRFLDAPRVTPELVGGGQPFVVTFRLSGPPIEGPFVTFDGIELPCESDGGDRPGFTCTGFATTPLDGLVSIVVIIGDALDATSEIFLYVDQTPPLMNAVAGTTSGYQDDNLTAPVRVYVYDNAPILGLAEDLDRSTLFAVEVGGDEPATCNAAASTCDLFLSRDLPDGPRDILVRARDFVGNEAEVLLADAVIVDTLPPFAPDVNDYVHRRRPWSPHVDVPFAFLDARYPSAEQGSVVRIYANDGEEAGELLAETSLPNSFDTVIVLARDTPRVHVRAVDAAGNTSASSVVKNGEFIVDANVGAPFVVRAVDALVEAVPLDAEQLAAAPLLLPDGDVYVRSGLRPAILAEVPFAVAGVDEATVGFVSVIVAAVASNNFGRPEARFWGGNTWSRHSITTGPDAEERFRKAQSAVFVLEGDERTLHAGVTIGRDDGDITVDQLAVGFRYTLP